MFKEKLTLAALVASMSGPLFAAVDKYEIEPNHTYPSFEFSHMGISFWRGKFNRTSGRITIDRAARTGTADIEIDTASINFGLDKMDQAARSEDWFNVAKFPTATYKGTLTFAGDVPRTVEGQFTLLGVTRPFFFSSRRRHTRLQGDWSSDVCSSDLPVAGLDPMFADQHIQGYETPDG